MDDSSRDGEPSRRGVLALLGDRGARTGRVSLLRCGPGAVRGGRAAHRGAGASRYALAGHEDHVAATSLVETVSWPDVVRVDLRVRNVAGAAAARVAGSVPTPRRPGACRSCRRRGGTGRSAGRGLRPARLDRVPRTADRGPARAGVHGGGATRAVAAAAAGGAGSADMTGWGRRAGTCCGPGAATAAVAVAGPALASPGRLRSTSRRASLRAAHQRGFVPMVDGSLVYMRGFGDAPRRCTTPRRA